jgi:hypothetical protein
MIAKFIVIANRNGDVVGTQAKPSGPDAATGTTTSLVAGPGQTLHEVDFEVPHLTCAADIDDFHRRLTKHLRK